MSILTRPVDVERCWTAAVKPLLPVLGRDQCVPLVDGRNVRHVHLDTAASAPALQSVADQVAAVLPHYSSVHRGAGYLSQVSTILYEQARRDVATFVGARLDDVVVFTRNTTDALNLLSTAVPGDVVVLDLEHHANLLPWQRIGARVVEVQATLAATEQALAVELARRPAALLAVTGASNVTGEVPDLARLTRLAHVHGARIVVDAAQLLPHREVDLASSGIDYVAFSGHKLYAPYGAGALVGRRDWLDEAPPYLAGGGAVREVTTTGTTWAASPERHEAGTPNVIGVAALAEACRTLAAIGIERRSTHEILLHHELVAGLARLGITPLAVWPDDGDLVERVGVASFVVPGVSASLVAAYLSAEHGIGVRDGRFCAHPLVARLLDHPAGQGSVGASDGGAGGTAVRVSLGVGSSSADVRRLLEALATLLSRGPSWTYVAVGGSCRPSPDPRPLPTAWPVTGRLDALPGADPSPCTSPTN